MTKSEDIGKLAEALSKAQSQIKGAKKDAKNPFFKSDYADLESVWEACREPLTANGLAIVQIPMDKQGGGFALETVLMHSSGQWISGEITMNPTKADPQGVGSAISYYRRYSLSSFAGIYQTDDDGNEASGKPEPKEAKKTTPKPEMEMGQTGPQPFRGVVEDSGVSKGDVAWVKFSDRVCTSDIDPHRSRLLDTNGEELELLIIGPVSKTKQGTPVYTVFQVLGSVGSETAKSKAEKLVEQIRAGVKDTDPFFGTNPDTGETKVSGTVTEVLPLKAGKALALKMGTTFLSCFHKSLYSALQGSTGKRCVFAYSLSKDGSYKNIERIDRIGDTEFMDGVPVIQMRNGKDTHATQ